MLYAIFNSFVCRTDGQLLLFIAVNFQLSQFVQFKWNQLENLQGGYTCKPYVCQKILDTEALSFVLRALLKFRFYIISLVCH